jgi:hypothetical protein
MPYDLAGETFSTKLQITGRCQKILETTPDGATVNEAAALLLFDLFRYHDEWLQKLGGGVRRISTQSTSHGTRCFVLENKSGEQIDISFPHAIRLLPSNRSADLLPQGLRNFRNGARTAVRTQIMTFRDKTLQINSACPYTGEELTRKNSSVDHTPPTTFDQLIFDFCQKTGLNPLDVEIGSLDGTVAVIADQDVRTKWQNYHQRNANLRLLSKIGNLQLPKILVPWSDLLP